MKTTRNTDQAGGYTVTGHTETGDPVQYTVSVTNNKTGWTARLVYGKGAELVKVYRTKAEAVQAVANQA